MTAGPSPTVGQPEVERVALFLVDDHELVRRGLRALLEEQPDLVVVGEAGSVHEARRGIRESRPDVVLVDGRLPDGHGVEICRELAGRAAEPDGRRVRSLLLTSYEDEEAVLAAVSAGVSGVLLKQVSRLDLVDAVRRVAGGASLLDPELVHRATERHHERSSVQVGLERLTRREREVADLIADGLTNRQIAERLSLSEKTVKNHVTGVLTKLGLQRRTQAATLLARRRPDG